MKVWRHVYGITTARAEVIYAGEYRLVYSTGTTTAGTGLLHHGTTVPYYPFTFQDYFCMTAVQPYVYGSTAGTTV
jgi:hypothetical protein